MRSERGRGMFVLDQVPATWFLRHRDPPPGVAREGSREGAFARCGDERLMSRSLAATYETLEPAAGLLQGALDLVQLSRRLFVR